MIVKQKFTKQVWAWATYDWANSAFATSLMAVFFPIFFKRYWTTGLSASESTFYLGITLSLMTLVFALIAPFLGSFSDWGNFSKKGVLVLAFTGSVSCFFLYFIPQGQWFQALLIYTLAWLSFSGANLLYDSLLPTITREEFLYPEIENQQHIPPRLTREAFCHQVSCFGYGLGYLGGGLLLVINALMIFNPGFFGLEDTIQATRWIFVSVGFWWLFFSLPFFYVKSRLVQSKGFNFFQGFKQVLFTFRRIRKNKNLFLFLLAYFFYIDGVYTIYKMAVDFALSIGLESRDLIKAVVIVQFVGFPATLLFSFLTERTGVKSGILIGIVIYSLVCFGGMFISTATHFYILATVLGLVQGGVQALSRSFYARLIPPQSSGEFFGFYNMFGKFSAILGPFLMGLTSQLTGNPHLSPHRCSGFIHHRGVFIKKSGGTNRINFPVWVFKGFPEIQYEKSRLFSVS